MNDHSHETSIERECCLTCTPRQQASLLPGTKVRRANGDVRTVNRVIRSARSGAHGTSVEISVVELLGGESYEYVDQYPESTRPRLASLTGRHPYPAAEFLAAVEG